MDRKTVVQLLVGGAVVLFLFAGVLNLACSSSKSSNTSSTGDITVTSTVTLAHSHQVTISGTDIDNPPSANKTINTTEYGTAGYGGHYHTITLTPQDYQTIKDGGTVIVTTSVVNGHTHDFTIKKS